MHLDSTAHHQNYDDSNTTVVVLAGGSSSRISAVSQGSPKSLLSVLGTPIIKRVLGYPLSSGLCHILVSTAPAYYPLFAASFGLWAPPPNTFLNLIANPLHRDGPAAALIGLHRSIATPFTLLLLGDVLFSRRPLMNLRRLAPRDNLGLLGCMKVPIHRSVQRGVVLSDAGYGVRLFARPAKPVYGAYAWSGLALLPTAWLRTADCQAFVGKPVDSLFGLNRQLSLFTVPPFVNINTPSDLLTASALIATRRERSDLALMLDEQNTRPKNQR